MITVRGIPVRSEEINQEVGFRELTEEGQRRLFLENQEKFIKDVLDSKNSAILELIDVTKNNFSLETLNAIIRYFVKKNRFSEAVLDILDFPRFKLAEETRRILATSLVKKYRLLMAKDKDTSLEILKLRTMFFWSAGDFMREKDDMELFDEIVMHPNFKVDEDIEKEISVFSCERQKKIRERIAELKNN